MGLYSAAFIFEPGRDDETFHQLNREIAEAAQGTPGFLGSETWVNDDGTRVNAVYYWETLEALEMLAAHPRHLEAKRRYAEWYHGFHVVISRVLESYGDGHIDHVTPNGRSL